MIIIGILLTVLILLEVYRTFFISFKDEVKEIKEEDTRKREKLRRDFETMMSYSIDKAIESKKR